MAAETHFGVFGLETDAGLARFQRCHDLILRIANARHDAKTGYNHTSHIYVSLLSGSELGVKVSLSDRFFNGLFNYVNYLLTIYVNLIYCSNHSPPFKERTHAMATTKDNKNQPDTLIEQLKDATGEAGFNALNGDGAQQNWAIGYFVGGALSIAGAADFLAAGLRLGFRDAAAMQTLDNVLETAKTEQTITTQEAKTLSEAFQMKTDMTAGAGLMLGGAIAAAWCYKKMKRAI
jgi:hypothetical protein